MSLIISKSIPITSSECTDKTEMHNFTRILEGKSLSEFNLIRFVVYGGMHSEPDQHVSKEYWYIASGQGLLNTGGNEINVSKGELYFFDSLVTHFIKNTSHEPLEILSIWW